MVARLIVRVVWPSRCATTCMTTQRDVQPPRCPTTAMSDHRNVRPIRTRALGVPSARVKIIEPERAKKRPLFLEKKEKGKKIAVFWKYFSKEAKNKSYWPTYLFCNAKFKPGAIWRVCSRHQNSSKSDYQSTLSIF